MGSNQLVRLKWNTHQSTLLTNLESYLNSETMADCTLSAEGHHLRAHKVILSACSPYFQELLSVDTEKHPIIYLHNVKYTELQALLSYMYRGEININQDNVPGFLRIAESLQMHGIFHSNSAMNSNKSTISDDCEEIKEEENDDLEEEVEEIMGDHNNMFKSKSTNQIKKDRFEVFPTTTTRTTKKKQNNNHHKNDINSSSNIIIVDRKRAPTRGRRSSASSSSSTTTITTTNQANDNNNIMGYGSINNQQQVPEEMNSQLLRVRNTDLIFNDFLDKFASSSANNFNLQKQQKLDQMLRISSLPQSLVTPTTAIGKSSSVLPCDLQNYHHRHVVNSMASNNNNNNNNNSSFPMKSVEKSAIASSSSSNVLDPFDQSGFYIPDLHNDELILTRKNESPFDENLSTNPDDEEFKYDEQMMQEELNPGTGGDQLYRCVKCAKQYTSNKSLWRHRKFTCDGRQTFSCLLCGKTFSRSDNLRRHAVVAHSAQ